MASLYELTKNFFRSTGNVIWWICGNGNRIKYIRLRNKFRNTIKRRVEIWN